MSDPQPSALPADLARLAEAVLADGRIDAADVRRLRQALFADNRISRAEADLLFHLNDRAGSGDDKAWHDLFVEALALHFLGQGEQPGAISEADGAYLVARITRDGGIATRTEADLLLHLMEKAWNCPEPVALLALRAVKEGVLEGGGVLFGPGRRRPGVVDEADLAVIRRAVFGTGGHGGIAVTRAEAEAVYDLHRATRGKPNAPGWPGLFVDAVGQHILFGGRPADDAEEAIVGDDEAVWLLARLADPPHADEVALLAFIAEHADEIPETLAAAFARHGVW
jgi:hypothetical protein